MSRLNKSFLILGVGFLALSSFKLVKEWNSKFVHQGKNHELVYLADEKGNTIPDFSHVGYHHGNKEIPDVAIVKTLTAPEGDAGSTIQKAIDEVSAYPIQKDGFRGAILLKKGTYQIAGTLFIKASGVVLRGEGEQTKLIATGTKQRSLIIINGTGKPKALTDTQTFITDEYVPTGAFSFRVKNADQFKAGDKVMVYRPGTEQWIKDLQMDRIVERPGTKQWKPEEYNLSYEREITQVKGDLITLDNPVVMPLELKYGGAQLYKYSFAGRLAEIGIEQMSFESEFSTDTAEDHAWTAIEMDNIENAWVRNVSAKYFGYSCVYLKSWAKNITVIDSRCTDAKSIITGGRRYSFNNNGQQNLFMNLESEDGRHDYVTGAKTCGPNVFYNCKARKTHADIGPHHRWASGTLYDNIDTDGEINVQDRGNWGSGHGWSGVTQVLWNCKVSAAAIQNPWVSGKNYAIGVQGKKTEGRLKGRQEAEWEGQNKNDLQPSSLYLAQKNNRKNK
ncbi:hypothetical protein [Pedobacter arcticus]|uniref:hypothetical protein n=1 Tax=Pedobacter arcticus TaxID=752140 RepID=UPI00031AF818|nr:hypothetical protein [Pedobacter arcticus]